MKNKVLKWSKDWKKLTKQTKRQYEIKGKKQGRSGWQQFLKEKSKKY